MPEYYLESYSSLVRVEAPGTVDVWVRQALVPTSENKQEKLKNKEKGSASPLNFIVLIKNHASREVWL